MSESDDDLDPDGNEPGDEGASSGPAPLRAENKKLKKQLQDAQAALDKLAAKDRSRDLAEFLKAKGAPERLAKYAARDIEGDVTEDAVQTWLTENGEDFGWEPNPDDTEVDETSAEFQAERIQRASASAPQGRPDSAAQLHTKIKTGSIEELQQAGILPKLDF